MAEPVQIVSVNFAELMHYMNPHTALFGLCVSIAVCMFLIVLAVIFLVKPKKYINEQLKDVSKWTPEMVYLANTRFVIGFLIGMLIASILCILIYVPWRV